MDFILPLILTVLTFLFVIIVLRKTEKIFLKQKKYSQTEIHNTFKKYHDIKKETEKKESQLSNRVDNNSINVVILEDKAYWVTNNIFYNADFVNGKVSTETIKPIDTSNLSKLEVDKMLFILDKLGDGKKNDSGSTR